jgi:hypothetical protein
MENIILISIVSASISILWRNTLNKFELNKKLQKKFPVFLGTALTCGSCFVYWISLFFIIIYSPVDLSFFTFNNFSNITIKYLSHLFLSWMMIGTIALYIRFIYVLIQENVNRLNHLNEQHPHNHK